MVRHPIKTTTLVVAVFLAASSAAFAFTQQRVNQSNLQFSMPSLKISRGETVVFSNGDRTSHNITVSGGNMNFDGGLQKPGQDIEVPFTSAGAFEVTCGIHPKMKMTVEVK